MKVYMIMIVKCLCKAYLKPSNILFSPTALVHLLEESLQCF